LPDSGGKKRRLFVGSFLAETERACLVELRACDQQLSAEWSRRLRWVTAEKMHLTWIFLGHVEEKFVDEICERLNGIAESHRKTAVDYTDVEFWPSPKLARHLVLTPAKVPAEVLAIAKHTKETLSDYVDKPETRPYRPHVTLLNLDSGPKMSLAIPDYLSIDNCLPLRQNLAKIDLIESRLGRGSDAYTSLKTFELK
jgi:2'-5' RNA ligase